MLLLAPAASIGVGATTFQNAPAESVERYAGEARVGSGPAMPVHLELRRSGSAASGIISTAGASFNLVDAQGGEIVTGRLQGDGAGGRIVLRFSGDTVEGTFDLEGQSGTIAARQTSRDAMSFLRGPEQKIDLSADQWREDLDRLVAILTKEHGSPFHHVSREKFMREAQRVRSAIPSLSGVAIALEFRKLGALIGDGHTSVALPSGRPRYPFGIYWFEDGLRVVSASEEHRALLGAKLVAVNGVPVAEVTRRLRAFIGQEETEWGSRSAIAYLIGSADILDAVKIGSALSRTFDFVTTDGRKQQIMISASAAPIKRVRLGGDLPLWQRNPGKPFWSERLPDGSLYVNWREYGTLGEDGAELMRTLKAQRPCRLIIDLRDNAGGDFMKGRAFIDQIRNESWLNRKDKLFVLVGRTTFSASMTNATDFKRATKAILVGEPAGAAPNNWQELRSFNLPNSGLSVGVSTRYYAFLPGKRAVEPDLRIPPQPQDWGSPQDGAVRHIMGLPCS